MKKEGVYITVLQFFVVFQCTASQVTLNPDPEEDVQLQITVLTPAIVVTTTQCYTSALEFKVQYVTPSDHEIVYDIISGYGSPVSASTCGQSQSQYRIMIDNLQFINDPVLVGGTFRLKSTINNDEGNRTYSKRTFTFPAPFNLTGSVTEVVLNDPFTWTCHVTQDYPILEWYRNSIKVGVMGLISGNCLTENTDASYTYDCQRSNLTYTLTIPGPNLTEREHGSLWRCRGYVSELKGSKYIKLNVNVPVTTLTLTPNNEVNVIEYEAVNISCETDLCRPAANIIWYKDNVLVNDNIIQSQRSYGDKYKTTSILTLIGDKREQKREIYCNATNLPNIPPVKSNVITINVLSPAEFDQNFYIFHLQLLSPMSITVPFYSNPHAQMSGVEWINKTGHSNTVVRPSDDISLSLVNADIGMETNKGQKAVMNITSVQRGHAGNYSLRIVNGATLTSNVDLWFVLFEKPQVPSNVTVICKHSGAELSWISGGNGGFNQVFQVLYKQEDESNFRVHHEKYKDTGEGRLVHATVTNITPRVIYNFKIIAINLHVNTSSEPKNCIILGKEPSSTANLGGVVGGITSAFIVIIIIISVAFILKLRGFCVFNRHRGSSNSNERSSEDKYDDILQPAETNIHSYTTGSTSDKIDDRSTYEELQSTREVHTYGDVGTSPAYSNLAVE